MVNFIIPKRNNEDNYSEQELIKLNQIATEIGVDETLEIMKSVHKKNMKMALKTISITNLVQLISESDIKNLIKGINIITPKQIEGIPYSKLRIIILNENMDSFEFMQRIYTEDNIIFALNKLNEEQINDLITETNKDKIKRNMLFYISMF